MCFRETIRLSKLFHLTHTSYSKVWVSLSISVLNDIMAQAASILIILRLL
jgi:hypothetical protein